MKKEMILFFAVITLLISCSREYDKKNRIVFNRNTGTYDQIFIIDNDTGNQVQITSGSYNSNYCSWSPDGKRIVFRSDRGGSSFDIFTMNSDGTNVKQLTNNTAGDDTPTWTTDGSRILFSSNISGNYDIYIINTDGSNLIQLTTDTYHEFDHSAGSLDIGKIQGAVKDISKDIKEFLVINNVIVDRETGFYSASYFNMKLSEQIYSAQKIGTGFYLLLIDIFRDIDIEKEQKNTVLKIIYPVIKKSSGEAHELFLQNGKIGMILPGIDLKEAENIELAVTKDISKFRIKLSADYTIRLKPVAAIMNSSEAGNVKEILKETLELFTAEG